MSDIISTFGSAITGFVEHIGNAIKAVSNNVLYDTAVVEGVTTQTLSTTAQVLLTFAGISLAISLCIGFVKLFKHH